MPERPLILTGFMGSGKSSVGKIVSDRLGYHFVDLDAEIVSVAKCSISNIFDRDGESAFRLLESNHLEKLLLREGKCVIATGGGAVISDQNRILMRKKGVVINLQVTLEQVITRLKGCSDRPLLAGDDSVMRAAVLMNAREQFYSDADIRIDTDGKSVEDVASELLRRLKGFTA